MKTKLFFPQLMPSQSNLRSNCALIFMLQAFVSQILFGVPLVSEQVQLVKRIRILIKIEIKANRKRKGDEKAA